MVISWRRVIYASGRLHGGLISRSTRGSWSSKPCMYGRQAALFSSTYPADTLLQNIFLTDTRYQGQSHRFCICLPVYGVDSLDFGRSKGWKMFAVTGASSAAFPSQHSARPCDGPVSPPRLAAYCQLQDTRHWETGIDVDPWMCALNGGLASVSISATAYTSSGLGPNVPCNAPSTHTRQTSYGSWHASPV